jgi:hypothetical protein
MRHKSMPTWSVRTSVRASRPRGHSLLTGTSKIYCNEKESVTEYIQPFFHLNALENRRCFSESRFVNEMLIHSIEWKAG